MLALGCIRLSALPSTAGRVVARRIRHPTSLKDVLYWGVVRYRGIRARPEYFEVRYNNGDMETLTMKQVEPMLKPHGTKLPYARKASTAQQPVRRSARQRVAAAAVTSWSDALYRTALRTATCCWTESMPGSWPEADSSAASEAVNMICSGAHPACRTPLALSPS
jgi:hypothetical protein